MAKLLVKQVRSTIKRSENQKRVMASLGLRKINHEVQHEATPEILGMINKVKHLVSVTEI
jgi:large subunit ribosomal protein L30